jgi:cobalt/nickel transport system permease protein
VNVAILPLLLTIPITVSGKSVAHLGPLVITDTGAELALQISLKVSALLIFTAALLGPLDEIRMGHALAHLCVPRKLALLLILVYRYLHVAEREYLTLRAAMKIRGFRPKLNLHTFRSLGYLIAMLLLRGSARSWRVLAAMKCRGFQGQFPLLWHFRFGPADLRFSAIFASCLILLAWWEWVV